MLQAHVLSSKSTDDMTDLQGYVSIPLLCSFKRMSSTLKLKHGTSAAEMPAELIAKVCSARSSWPLCLQGLA